MGTLKLPEDKIYCKSQVNNKMIKIIAIFETVRTANEYLTQNKDEGVVYQADNLIFIAKNDDLGENICINCGSTNTYKTEETSGLFCESCEKQVMDGILDDE